MHLFPVMFAFLIFVASEAFERCDCVFRLSVYMNILICLYDIIYVGLIPPCVDGQYLVCGRCGCLR